MARRFRRSIALLSLFAVNLTIRVAAQQGGSGGSATGTNTGTEAISVTGTLVDTVTGSRGARGQTNASASAAANSAGTTVNNQNNSQINTNTFYGFGPGINCPTSTFAISGFTGSGDGRSGGDVLGAFVDSDTYGGIASFTMPIAPTNSEICSDIGEAQRELLRAQVAKVRMDAAKTQADVNLVTMLKCIEVLRAASLSGPFAQICQGILPHGMARRPMPSPRTLPNSSTIRVPPN